MLLVRPDTSSPTPMPTGVALAISSTCSQDAVVIEQAMDRIDSAAPCCLAGTVCGSVIECIGQ